MELNKRSATSKIEVFNNRRLCCILGLTRAQQHAGRVNSVQVRKLFDMDTLIEDVVAARRLCWVGHVARMEENRIPKKLLFGWPPQRRPAHGTKMRWRDTVRQDLKRFGVVKGE